MFTGGKRAVMIMAVASVMNLGLFLLAYYLNLPLWLDTTGTIYAALILGFPSGFIVAIINNVTQAIFFYGLESMRFYLVSALTALVTGVVMTRCRRFRVGKWFLLILALILLSASLSVLLNFVAYGGVPADYWGQRLYAYFTNSGLESWKATVAAVVMIKIPDILVSVGIVGLAYRLTPKVIREDTAAVVG